MEPCPLIVVATGIELRVAKASSAPHASERITPPPAKINGLFAFSKDPSALAIESGLGYGRDTSGRRFFVSARVTSAE